VSLSMGIQQTRGVSASSLVRTTPLLHISTCPGKHSFMTTSCSQRFRFCFLPHVANVSLEIHRDYEEVLDTGMNMTRELGMENSLTSPLQSRPSFAFYGDLPNLLERSARKREGRASLSLPRKPDGESHSRRGCLEKFSQRGRITTNARFSRLRIVVGAKKRYFDDEITELVGCLGGFTSYNVPFRDTWGQFHQEYTRERDGFIIHSIHVHTR
jgi:hypothetical protein